MCFVFAITLSVCMILFSLNYVAFAFEYQITTVLSGGSADVDTEALQEANRQGKEVAIQIGEEGFTLLRNENKALPLGEDERKVSVFGRASSDKNFWYMGLGSGSGPKSGRVTLYGGLEEAGLELAPALKDKYNSLPARTDTYSDAETGLNHTTAYELYEPGQEWLNEDGMLADAAENYPTAIVVIGRGGSEDGDYDKYQTFTDDSGREVAESAARKDTTRLYNEISAQEEELLSLVRQLYDKVIVVINSGNVMDLGFIDGDAVDAALVVGYPGQSGTKSIARVLKGSVNPSGRLTDTYTREPESDPSFVNAIKTTHSTGDHIHYTEDIYIGYKWYETADAEGYFEAVGKSYDTVVQYPFGYGMSYTSFDSRITGYKLSTSGSGLLRATEVTVTVEVTNTHAEVSGKEVVQLYATPPYTEGEIEKPHVMLVAFTKTDELAPGETKSYDLTFRSYDLASYDAYDADGDGRTGFVLEEGEYKIMLLDNAHGWKGLSESAENTVSLTAENTVQYKRDPDTGAMVKNRFGMFDSDGNYIDGSAYADVPIDGSTAGLPVE